jgi:hypothetical protein
MRELTDVIRYTLDGRDTDLWYFLVLVDVSEINIGELCPVRPAMLAFILSAVDETYQRCTPRLSTCAVAKKSPVGEKVTLVAMELVRKASTSLPVGMSNVRIVESSEVAINHLESGENVF